MIDSMSFDCSIDICSVILQLLKMFIIDEHCVNNADLADRIPIYNEFCLQETRQEKTQLM